MLYLTIHLKTAIKKYGKNEKLEGKNQSKTPSPLMDEFQIGENKIELKSKKTEMFY